METTDPLPTAAPVAAPARRSVARWLIVPVAVLALAGGGFAGYSYRQPIVAFFEPPPPAIAAKPAEVVGVPAPGLIRVARDSSLDKKLVLDTAQMERAVNPVLTVTGSVAARLSPGRDEAEARWDFAATEVATAYSDWIKARADVGFAETQLVKVNQLVVARVAKLSADVTRLEKLVAIGTEAERDLAGVRADRLQADIQGSKDVFEAETAKKTAARNRGLLERQLLQAGIDPTVVLGTTDGVVLVVADVPESKIGLVHLGLACEATFISRPGEVFRGRVGRVGPSVSKDRRTLRVTFELHDTDGRLLPGMYADVGLGTEPRERLTVPSDAVLHSGKCDYVLVWDGPGEFRVAEVRVDEATPQSPGQPKGALARVSVAGPVREGEQVIAAGAILLKPALVQALIPVSLKQ